MSLHFQVPYINTPLDRLYVFFKMKLVVSVFFLLIFFGFDDVFAEKCSKTPLTIRKDFISNCIDLNLGLIRCLRAWFAFKSAFSGRDPATVVSESVVNILVLIIILSF